MHAHRVIVTVSSKEKWVEQYKVASHVEVKDWVGRLYFVASKLASLALGHASFNQCSLSAHGVDIKGGSL